MKWYKGLLIVVMFALMVPMAGCCGGGTDTKIVEKQPVKEVPLGDELIKLKEAHDKGALTDKEYEAAKAKLLKGK